MLNAIKTFFENKLSPEDSNDQDENLIKKSELASAALMIEVMNSDHELDERETKSFISVLRDSFQLNSEELSEIVALANEEAKQATSLYEFTQLINDNYNYQQKVQLIENMWTIAFSDEKLDKYEDNLIRKISELIYVSHRDFIQTKLRARGKNRPGEA